MGPHKKKKKRDSSSSESEDETPTKKRKHSSTKKKKRLKKRKYESSTSSDTTSTEDTSSDSEEERKKVKKKQKKAKKKKVEKKDDETSTDIPLDLMTKSKGMAPMTKEEWEKRQSVVKRVYDESTGRHRLIKGDGEVIEEIVSRDRHNAINQQATKGDGGFFQAQMARNLKK